MFEKHLTNENNIPDSDSLRISQNYIALHETPSDARSCNTGTGLGFTSM